jgi:class 3 adenylate cyclase
MSSVHAFGNRLFKLMIPGILLILPYLVLHTEIQEIKKTQQERLTREWVQRTRDLAPLLQETTRPEYWAETTSRRLRHRLTRHLSRPPAALGTADDFRQLVQSALPTAAPPGVPRPRAWVAFFPDGNPEHSGILLQGEGLESQFRALFLPLLQEIGRNGAGNTAPANPELLTQRIRSLFGDGTGTELFNPDKRGKAFYGVFQRQYGLITWDWIKSGSNVMAAYLLFTPLSRNHTLFALKAVLKNWHRIAPSTPLLPVFLPVFGGGRSQERPVLFPAEGPKTAMRAFVRRIRQHTRIYCSPGTPQLGRWRLPLEYLRTPISCDDQQALLIPLSPNIGYFCLGTSPRLPSPTLFSETLARWYGRFAGLWLLYLLVATMIPGLWFSPRLKTQLIGWFLGILALPVALIIVSSERLQGDQTHSTKETYMQNLQHQLGKIDSGSSILLPRFLGVCREISALLQGVAPTAARPVTAIDDRRLQDSLLSRCASSGMEVNGLLLFWKGGKTLTHFSPAVPPAIASALVRFHRFLAEDNLRGGQIADRNTLLDRNRDFTRDPGEIKHFMFGDKQSFRYYDVIPDGQEPALVLFVIWDQDKVYADYLNHSIPKALRDAPGLTLETFRLEEEAFSPITGGGASASRALLRAQVRRTSGAIEQDGYLLVRHPSRLMPRYFLSAAVSLEPLYQRLRQTRRRLAGTVTLLLLTALFFGAACAAWFSRPLVRMTEGLIEVSNNNLCVQVFDPRHDELGHASRTLDKMVTKLREAQVVSSFVPSSVLEIVSGGSLSQAAQGSRREAVLLVSDVRSFTTMSEAYPPAVIFSLLNHHLAAMTRAIQRHGGVVERFIGDAVQAVFFPRPGEPTEVRAIRAGLEMMSEHHRLNRERREQNLFEYGIGVGIECGEVICGVLGDPQVRLDWSAMGEPMKHAADLEALSKKGQDTLIICSPQVRKAAASYFGFHPMPGDHPGENVWEVASREISCTDSGTVSGTVSHTVCGDPSVGRAPAPLPISPAATAPPQGAPSPDAEHAPPPQVTFATPSRSFPCPAPALLARSAGPARPMPTVPESKSVEPHLVGMTTVIAPPSVYGAADADKTGTGSQSLGTRQLPQLIGGLLIWLLPLVLLGFALQGFQSQVQERQAREIRALLQEDLTVVERSADPVAQFALMMNRHIENALGQAEKRSTTPFPVFQENLLRRFQEVRRTIPSLQWYVFRHEPIGSAPYAPTTYESTVLATFSSGLFPFDLRFMEKAFTRLKTEIMGTSVHLEDSGFRATMTETFGVDEYSRVRDSSLNQWHPVFPQRIPGYLNWVPVFSSSLRTFLGKPKTPMSPKQVAQQIKKGLLGGLMLFVARDDLTSVTARQHLIFTLADRGAFLAAVPGDTHSAPMQAHPSFQADPRWQKALTRFRETGEVPRFPGWDCLTGDLIGAQPVPFLVARELPPLPTEMAALSQLFFLLVLFWSLCGILLLVRFLYFGGSLALSLKWQLSMAFLFALIPLLQQASFSLQQADQEHRLGLIHEQRQAITETLGVIEQSHDVFLGGLVSFCGAALDEPWLARLLKHRRHAKERVQNLTMDVLNNRLVTRGIHTTNPVLVGAGNQTISGNSRGQKPDILLQTLRLLNQAVLRTLNPSLAQNLKISGKDFGLGMLIEEGKSLFQSVIPPELMAETSMAPHSLGELNFMGKRTYSYRKHLFEDGLPAHSFLAHFRGEALNNHLLNFWFAFLASQSPLPLHLDALQQLAPGYEAFPPYYDATINRHDNVEMTGFLRPTLVGQLSQGVLARTAPMTFFQQTGTGRDLSIRGTAMSAKLGDLTFSLHCPVGRYLERLRSHSLFKNFLMMIFLLLSAAMALSAARQFLVPLFALRHHAERIIAEQYETRMPEHFDGEFGQLARAFNVMAQRVSEGNLLSRFVSESVLLAAQNEDERRAAQKGEMRSATVVFVGITTIKTLLASHPAAELVDHINRHLQTMSRIIRAHGGDIDKFIGEKILAVFHPDRLGGEPQSAEAALRCAAEMRRAMTTLSAFAGFPLAVGIVSGPLLTGIMGTPEVRLELTVIGDTVNLASRLGDVATRLNSAFQVEDHPDHPTGGIVFAETTYAWLPVNAEDAENGAAGHPANLRLQARKLNLPPIKGKTKTVEAYALI